MNNFAVLFLLLSVGLFVRSNLAAPPSAKISPTLQSSLAKSGSVEILISFGGTGNSLAQIESRSFETRSGRLQTIVETLKGHAAPQQERVLHFLTKQRSSSLEKVVRLWISNQIYVQGATAEIVHTLAEFDEVSYIQENEYIPLEQSVRVESEGKSRKDNGALAPEWNVVSIRAPEVWAADGGNTGEGVIVATIDTGVRGTHEALRDNYGGQWLDPYSGSATPIDYNGHGTHSMGILAGKGGIGVAPGSRWIACRGCDTGSCGQAQLLQCGQWAVYPNSDCSAAPDIVSNNWGGGRGDTFYDNVISAWTAAGILPFWIGGNSGPSCGSVNSPADKSTVFGIGSLTSSNSLSSFSSRGPGMNGAIKPDVCAPSGSINSAYHTSDTAYATLSGTSMSTPHAAGAVALLRSRNGSLTFQQIKSLFDRTSNTNLVPTGQNCGGIPDSEFPNNSYGAGKVDAFAAFSAL